MQDKTKFEFFGLKAEAEGQTGVKVAAALCSLGLITIIALTIIA